MKPSKTKITTQQQLIELNELIEKQKVERNRDLEQIKRNVKNLNLFQDIPLKSE